MLLDMSNTPNEKAIREKLSQVAGRKLEARVERILEILRPALAGTEDCRSARNLALMRLVEVSATDGKWATHLCVYRHDFQDAAEATERFRVMADLLTALDGGESEDDTDAVLDERLEDCGLSVRARNPLDAAGLRTLRDLVVLRERDLLGFKNLGKSSLHEIKARLLERSLCLGMSKDVSHE